MLLRFGIQNFRSFRDYTEVSFASTARTDEPTWRMPCDHVKHGVLPAIGVWGANASGKSNLLAGLMELRNAVRDSFIALKPDQPVPWTPFRMRRSSDAPPTRLDADVVVEGVRYHFGFEHTAVGFLQEWLFAWRGSRRQVLYHRNVREQDPWYLGPGLRGDRRLIAAATRPNSLFLSAAAQYDHEQLQPVWGALASPIDESGGMLRRTVLLFDPGSPVLDPRLRDIVLDLLRQADIGVVGLRTVEEPGFLDEARRALTPMLSPGLATQVLDRLEKTGPPLALRLDHGPAADPWEAEPEHESQGTQALVARLNEVLGALREGSLLAIDELDTSLHPDLCAALVGLFTSERTNPKGAQILFTTHDRGLLGQLRTDEVALVDRNADGASVVTMASDHRDVRSRDDLRRAHEQGRIRGVPVLGDLATVVEGLHRGS